MDRVLAFVVAGPGDTGPKTITGTAIMIVAIALSIFLLCIVVIVVVDRRRVKALKQARMDEAPRPRRNA